MRKLLAAEFGIKTDEELERALKNKGGIRIGVLTDEAKTSDKKRKAVALVQKEQCLPVPDRSVSNRSVVWSDDSGNS